MLAPAAPPQTILVPASGPPVCRINVRADGTVLLANIGAHHTAPVASLSVALAKAERIVRMLQAGGRRIGEA